MIEVENRIKLLKEYLDIYNQLLVACCGKGLSLDLLNHNREKYLSQFTFDFFIDNYDDITKKTKRECWIVFNDNMNSGKCFYQEDINKCIAYKYYNYFYHFKYYTSDTIYNTNNLK